MVVEGQALGRHEDGGDGERGNGETSLSVSATTGTPAAAA